MCQVTICPLEAVATGGTSTWARWALSTDRPWPQVLVILARLLGWLLLSEDRTWNISMACQSAADQCFWQVQQTFGCKRSLLRKKAAQLAVHVYGACRVLTCTCGALDQCSVTLTGSVSIRRGRAGGACGNSPVKLRGCCTHGYTWHHHCGGSNIITDW
jgi:hypothetical protein